MFEDRGMMLRGAIMGLALLCVSAVVVGIPAWATRNMVHITAKTIPKGFGIAKPQPAQLLKQAKAATELR